jgi:hypothetical protein
MEMLEPELALATILFASKFLEFILDPLDEFTSNWLVSPLKVIEEPEEALAVVVIEIASMETKEPLELCTDKSSKFKLRDALDPLDVCKFKLSNSRDNSTLDPLDNSIIKFSNLKSSVDVNLTPLETSKRSKFSEK